ncbi:hypothetical protein quinque_012172 [Culex quinquefasciatus]
MSFLLVCAIICAILVDSAEPFECGIRKVRTTEVIVNGHESSPGKWPWHAAIYYREDRRTSKLGMHSLDVMNPWIMQENDVRKIHCVGNDGSGKKNDVALLELMTEVRLTSYIQPACVNQVVDLSDKVGTVVGWGVTEHDELSPVLKESQMPVIDTRICIESNRAVFGQALDSSVFCAGFTNGTTVCNGDSGGGLFFQRSDVWYVGGIVSFTEQRKGSQLCQTTGYAGFTDLSGLLSWIMNVTELGYLLEQGEDRVGRGSKDDDDDSTTTAINLLPKQCGVYTVNRIVGGQNANLYEFPWMAILLYNDDVFRATGSLISKRYVLTIALCKYPNKPVQVRLGDHVRDQYKDCSPNDATFCTPPVRDYDIEKCEQHITFKSRNTTAMYDIGLLRLTRDVVFEDHIQPICLPVTDALRQLKLSSYIIAGWGSTRAENATLVLRKATVPAASCSTYHDKLKVVGFTDNDALLCAGGKGTATCSRDTGGPLGNLVQHNGMRFVQFGIASFSSKNCGVLPSVYISVSHHMDWILAIVEP